MWRRVLGVVSRRRYSTEPEIPSLYSFLRPSIFSLRTADPLSAAAPKPNDATQKSLTQDQKSHLESALQASLTAHNTDEAWKSFKALSSRSAFPSKSLANSLIAHLSSLSDTLNLKRAFASVVFLIEKNPELLHHETVQNLLDSMRNANTAAPAFALVKCMFKNRFFVPFSLWGNALVDISRKTGSLVAYFHIFNESCRIAMDEKLVFLKPNLAACNAALECCCRVLESVSDANKVVDTMSILGVRPDEFSFELLAYLYARKGMKDKILELEDLVTRFGFPNSKVVLSSLISGYMKSGSLESVSATIMHNLREGVSGEGIGLGEGTYTEIVRGFLDNGGMKNLASLIVETQKLESSSIVAEKSVGYGVISACVNLGLLDKAHSVLEEMNIQGTCFSLGVYIPILNAYCKERRTAEATQLVMEISSSGFQLDAGMYDSLIEASMSCQDFQSAFSLFRDMREARISDLKGSYLTIMTGLTESHRPELMVSFLDEVVEDPRIVIGTHDWNSIIHAFCKAGRMEDARRTFRRMTFLRFEPNEQTYLSLINGYVAVEKYFNVLMLWTEVKRKISANGERRFKLDNSLVDAFLYALVKGGFFDAVMQVVEKSQEAKIFVDKWRYKQAFMEKHKKLRVSKLRRRNFRKMESLIAFKNWAGLNA
nr:pentatricopeptide repeat-containing protein At1g69290 [Ipomoea trifida]